MLPETDGLLDPIHSLASLPRCGCCAALRRPPLILSGVLRSHVFLGSVYVIRVLSLLHGIILHNARNEWTRETHIPTASRDILHLNDLIKLLLVSHGLLFTRAHDCQRNIVGPEPRFGFIKSGDLAR